MSAMVISRDVVGAMGVKEGTGGRAFDLGLELGCDWDLRFLAAESTAVIPASIYTPEHEGERSDCRT